jgi:hypothetical protein
MKEKGLQRNESLKYIDRMERWKKVLAKENQNKESVSRQK